MFEPTKNPFLLLLIACLCATTACQVFEESNYSMTTDKVKQLAFSEDLSLILVCSEAGPHPGVAVYRYN